MKKILGGLVGCILIGVLACAPAKQEIKNETPLLTPTSIPTAVLTPTPEIVAEEISTPQTQPAARKPSKTFQPQAKPIPAPEKAARSETGLTARPATTEKIQDEYTEPVEHGREETGAEIGPAAQTGDRESEAGNLEIRAADLTPIPTLPAEPSFQATFPWGWILLALLIVGFGVLLIIRYSQQRTASATVSHQTLDNARHLERTRVETRSKAEPVEAPHLQAKPEVHAPVHPKSVVNEVEADLTRLKREESETKPEPLPAGSQVKDEKPKVTRRVKSKGAKRVKKVAKKVAKPRQAKATGSKTKQVKKAAPKASNIIPLRRRRAASAAKRKTEATILPFKRKQTG